MFVTTRGDREAQNENTNSRNQSTEGLDAKGVQQRADATPELTRRGKYEVDALVRWFGGPVLADTIA